MSSGTGVSGRTLRRTLCVDAVAGITKPILLWREIKNVVPVPGSMKLPTRSGFHPYEAKMFVRVFSLLTTQRALALARVRGP